MAGRMALMIGQRPTDLLGLRGPDIKRFLLDAMIISEVLSELSREDKARSTKQLVLSKRSGWRPPRRMGRWAS